LRETTPAVLGPSDLNAGIESVQLGRPDFGWVGDLL